MEKLNKIKEQYKDGIALYEQFGLEIKIEQGDKLFIMGTIEIYTDGAFTPYVFTNAKEYEAFKNKERESIVESYTNIRAYNRRLNQLVSKKYTTL